jgi:lysophospholipase L1-like esterase
MIVRTRPSIILFGDSITQQGFSGWVSRLSDAYTRRADVLNRGYSGYNTRHALDMLPYVFGPDCNAEDDKTDNVLMVTVFFGANDASLPGDREHCQHVPIDEYESNLRKIVKSIR